MDYAARVSTVNPTCVLFLVDQSSSMSDRIGSASPGAPKLDSLLSHHSPQPIGDDTDLKRSGMSKAAFVAAIINRALNQLISRCSTASSEVSDYFHVALLGYGYGVTPLLRREVMSISDIARHPLTSSPHASVEGDRTLHAGDGVWLEPNALGGTAMCHALRRAGTLLDDWLSRHPGCFPPIVVNLTDGEATDGDPLGAASDLKQLRSSDGHVLLFNCHISSQPGEPIQFPSTQDGLPDQHARRLFEMSSVMPPGIRSEAANSLWRQLNEGARGFVFQGDMAAVTLFVEVGAEGALLTKGTSAVGVPGTEAEFGHTDPAIGGDSILDQMLRI